MKTHDIICEADGWAYLVDGVRVGTYPSWLMAINAARSSAERDVRAGVAASLRCQGLDGQMRPLQSRGMSKALNPSQMGMQPLPGSSPDMRRTANG